MNKLLLAICLLCTVKAFNQNNYWQQKLNYDIKVTLDDKAKTLKGTETILYKNNSPETLSFIWFHIYPNAYKNKTTALFKQIENDASRMEKMKNITYGFISGLQFKVNNIIAKTEAHPNKDYIDVIKVLLPKPLKSGESIQISTPFTVKLPNYFSRSGFADGEFMATQWYPKPAVYDANGWNEFPYLDMGEFYSEYANYMVNITVPKDYVVSATGVLQTKSELIAYKKIGSTNAANRNAKPLLYSSTVNTPTKTLTYIADSVPDFAFFTDKKLTILYDTIQLKTGNPIDAFVFYYPKENTIWNNSIDYVKDAVHNYSRYIGDYAYPTVQVVEGPKNNASGGMEYPMVTLITSPNAKIESLDGVIAHEVGHNWFMSFFGSNERVHGWMDEGLNTYFQFRYEAEKYKTNSILGEYLPAEAKKLSLEKFQKMTYAMLESIPINNAIETPSADFKTSDEYGLTIYMKTAMWMYSLEEKYGRKFIDDAFAMYFKEWKFKHPQPADFKAVLEKSLGKNLDIEFELLKKKGSLK
jgi:Peptidase family M1 domain